MRKSMTRTATALIASGLVITACSSSENGPQPKSDRIEIMYIASQTDQGVCRPEARITVDKKSTGLYKIHGETRYQDVRSNESTNIPLQFTFPGYDPDTGIAESRSSVGLNTDTPCEHLRIRASIEYCLYDDNRSEEQACQIPVNLIGEGFAELVVTEDYPG